MSERFGFLHIGKTAGSSVKTLLDEVSETSEVPIEVFGHHKRLPGILASDESLRVGFLVRDPLERFVSGFNARLRAGRPTYDYPWSLEEAVAFRWFSTPNELGEALFGDDERLFSAACFAMGAIPHLRRNYAFHLKSVAYLRSKWERIYFVGNVTDLAWNIADLLAPLGIPAEEARSRLRHLNVAPEEDDVVLSEKAAAGVRRFWARDFEIYEFLMKRCKGVEETAA